MALRRPLLPLLLLALPLAACVERQDEPSLVRDLRVLAVALEPPELMAPTCATDDPAALLTFMAPVRLDALLQDPAGQGRALAWTLRACARTDDATCTREGESVQLAAGEAAPGVLTRVVRPGMAALADGTLLVRRVAEEDRNKGLGGIRMPLVLEVRAGDEVVQAQKLAVFSCRLFPEMRPNVNPALPGLTLEGAPLGEQDVPELVGPGPFALEPLDFTALEEPYTVPTYSLEPLALEERWKLAWYTTLGRIAPDETGGVELGDAAQVRHRTGWTPPRDAGPQEVRLWVTVRDGRGGMGWLERRVRWRPE